MQANRIDIELSETLIEGRGGTTKEALA